MLVVVAIFIAVAAAIPIGFFVLTYDSHFEFSLRITNKGPEVSGFELIVPIPQAPKLLDAIDQSKLGVSVSPSGPQAYNYSLERVTIGDSEIMMLRVSADFPKSPLDLPRPSLLLSAHIASGHSINTNHPVGREPLVEPMTNVTRGSDMDLSVMPLPYDIVFESIFFTNSAANISSNGIGIEVSWMGWNEWFMVIGWGGSSFYQQVRVGVVEAFDDALQVQFRDGWNTVCGGVWTDF